VAEVMEVTCRARMSGTGERRWVNEKAQLKREGVNR
jgi:hypothetical protein